MKAPVVFVHGMFQNPKSWENWISLFKREGYDCVAPAWPFHNGAPSALRANPPAGLGDLRLDQVRIEIEKVIDQLGEKPVVIGHSVGGLLVQLLANKGLIKLGVAISSVAPNAMLSADWDFFVNSTKIVNPFKGDEPFFMTPEAFHGAFCNTLSDQQAQIAYDRTALHDSRNVLRDCMLSPGHADLHKTHVPLLFIAGSEDKIVPSQLVKKNSEAYKDEVSQVYFREYPGKSHFICGEPGWEEIAEYVSGWITEKSNERDGQVTSSEFPSGRSSSL